VTSAGALHRDIYTLAGLFRYDVGSTYFGGGYAGDWGNGSLTDNVLNGTGSFKSHGYVAAAYLGRVFTLFDGISYVSPPFHTKEPPKPVAGYSLQLDVTRYAAYVNERIDGFTESQGFAWGDERKRYWSAGGRAKLFWTLPGGRWTWSPFVAATLDSQFSFSHTVDIPAQALHGVALDADTLFTGGAQTFWGGQIGVDVLDVSGVKFGINGYYRDSSQYQDAGGRAYIKFPFLHWLSTPAIAARNY